MRSLVPDRNPVPRFETLETSDPDVLTAGLQAAVPGVVAQPLHGTSMHAHVVVTNFLDVGMFAARFQNVAFTASEPRDYAGATIPLRGTCRITNDGNRFDLHAGVVQITGSDADFDARMPEDGCEFIAVMVSRERLESMAGQGGSSPRDGLKFDTLLRSPGGAGSFAGQACETWRRLREGGSFLDSGIAVHEATDALVRSMVEGAGGGGILEHANGHHVAEIAAEYITENLAGVLTLTDIAAVAGTSVRSLTRVFRNRYGTSPLQFIRGRRLEAVRRKLLVADPGPTTVTDVAMDFGFWHLGRFSASYREAFGESPSATLKRR